MGVGVESDRSGPAQREPALAIRMLGPMTISRGATEQELPASRKMRALLAYLAIAQRPLTRSHLCELLWEEVASDPRGELRWCLSKIRGLVDEPGHKRVKTRGDTIEVDLADCFVDVLEIAHAIEKNIETLAPDRQRDLATLFQGDLLEGLEIERSPGFESWLTAQRRRLRSYHTALLEHLATSVADEEAFTHLDKWLALAPLDRHVHEILLKALARRGCIREAEEHLAATAKLFESEGLDFKPIREAWRLARVAAPSPLSTSPREEARGDGHSRRASIAVMPFVEQSPTNAHVGTGAALAHDVISRLAKLRSMFVIAQDSVFALHERQVGPEDAGRALNVDYVVSGSVRHQGTRLTVAVELTETRSARIIWAEVFDQKLHDAFLVLDEIGNRIVASVASEVELVERNRAILKPPSSLDAWEAHHRGLWHMYRFNKPDNERAQHFFETATRLDPTFARAHAGLSFTHFQKAFQGWAEREAAVDRAYDAAQQSLLADDRDPAAHCAMGRALWLHGRQDQSVVELERAVDLSPNFAVGHYTLAFVHSQAGDPQAAIRCADHSRELSPFDPLLFAMLGARAMALVRMGEVQEAAHWASMGAARPNAHHHVRALAAFTLALSGSLDAARAQAAAIHKSQPGYRTADFFGAFQFDQEGAALFRQGAKLIGMA